MNIRLRYNLILFSLILFAGSAVAQVEVDIDRGDFKNRKSGFRDAWGAVKDADDFYEMRSKGGFRRALPLYEKAVAYNPDYAPLNYKLGVCYMADKQHEKAAEYIEKA